MSFPEAQFLELQPGRVAGTLSSARSTPTCKRCPSSSISAFMNPDDAHKIECSLSTRYIVGTCVNRYALLTAYPLRASSTSMGNVSRNCAANFFDADGSTC